jgi:hypothetical protein
MAESEVARLRQQIEDECLALRRCFYGVAIRAPHWLISCKYSALDRYNDELAEHIGQEEAITTVLEIYNSILK